MDGFAREMGSRLLGGLNDRLLSCRGYGELVGVERRRREM